MNTVSRWIAIAAMLLIVVLSTSCVRSSSTNSLQEGELLYEEPILLRVPYSYSDIELPEGDVGDNNFISRYILKKTGIEVQYSWEASGEEQYNTKLELAIRSNDLPDAFIVNRKQLFQLAERELIEELDTYYEQYSSPLVKSIYESTDGKALEEATIDGKLFGLPNVGIEADAPTYVWIRQDWLDKLKLEAPRTLEDIENIALAFIHRDPDGNNEHDTYGLPVDKSLVYQQKTGVLGLDSFFASFNAFPQNWIVNRDGHLVYGSIQEETRAALEKLTDWYNKGIIDRDFMLRKDAGLLVTQNQVGMIFAPWWAPFWPLSASVSLDTKAEWKAYMAPLDATGQFVTKTAPITDRYLVVRKGYQHPEAAVALLNLFTALERYEDVQDEASDEIRGIAAQLGVQLRNYFPFDLLLDDPDGVAKRYEMLQQLLAGERGEEELTPELSRLYQYVVQEAEQPKKDMEAWSVSEAYMQGGKISKQSMIKVESYNIEHLPAYSAYWEQLLELEMDYFLKIITGELPISSFDKFVEEWMSVGGIQLMREASEAFAQQKNN